MSIFSIWPMALIIGTGVAFLSIPRVFAFLDSPPAVNPHRLDSLDGIRGFLAVGVFFHHITIGTYGAKTGHPGMGVSHFYSFLGPAAVSVFFMITGYLFWDKLLKRDGAVAWLDLYVNRLFRIYPMYLVLMIAYFIIAYAFTVGEVTQPLGVLVHQAAQWLALGVVKDPTPFLDNPNILPVVGQTWSLRYEWLFYASLPILSVFARGKSSVAITASALFLVLSSSALDDSYRWFVAEFLCGMLTASLLRTYPTVRGDGTVKSIVATVLGVAAFMSSTSPYSAMPTLLLGTAFFLIASGASAFGILHTAGAKRLGNMSYSIYLLHGLLIAIVMTRPGVMPYAIGSDPQFWTVVALLFLLIITISAFTFTVVERGGIRLGRKIKSPRNASSVAA